jgi:hypothetical protein
LATADDAVLISRERYDHALCGMTRTGRAARCRRDNPGSA